MFNYGLPKIDQVFSTKKKFDIRLLEKALFLICILIVATGCSNKPTTSTTVEPWYPTTNKNGDVIFAVFESRIPCDDCEKIKFALALYMDSETKAPTTYQMSRVYVGKGNDRTINEGTWTISQGTNLDNQAIVYQLDTNVPQEFRSFWAIGDDILFILDQKMNPRVGTAGYSYALNRIP
jgi:hypothetical protein